MSWRDTQLTWYAGDIIQQDYDLKQFIDKQQINAIRYLGDSAYLRPIIGQEQEPAQMIIWLVNQKFEFNDTVARCNMELKNLGTGGILYLAINKFLAVPDPHKDIIESYDQAIYDYIKSNVHYNILGYQSGVDDGGKKFNWVHPLTRFYFYNENTV